MTKPRILVIDDDQAITSTISAFLRAHGYGVTVANDGEDALEEIRSGAYPVIVSDIYIDRVSGLDILRAARERDPDASVILMTARGSVRTTVEAEMGGAFEYLAKPFEMPVLLSAVERACCTRTPAGPEEDTGQYGSIIGFAPPMIEVYKKIARAARSDETVLISGETGSGKELVARAIHENGTRAGQPFIAVDAGAIPGTLWESELFGSVRGAFTGADRDRPGVVETARGGTVFLDEVGEIPAEFQAKLLRFLQEKEFRPVGSAAPRKADVRVIAATNRQLEAMVRDGRFREDLFYRLNVLRIDVPPLRERRGDIPFLLSRFIAEAAGAGGRRIWFEPEAERFLTEYDWPGNVRQLENLVRRLAALGPGGPVSVNDLQLPGETAAAAQQDEPAELDEIERRQILRVLAQTGGNKTRAAEILGIQRRTLYKKLERMERERFGHTGVPETQE